MRSKLEPAESPSHLITIYHWVSLSSHMLLKVYECNKDNYFNLVMSASTQLPYFKLVHMLEILT